MKTSIGLQQETKSALARSKPPGISWDEFFRMLHDSIDPKAYRKNLERTVDRLEKESVDAAIERVYAMRTNPGTNLTYTEARARLKRRRLARKLHLLGEHLESHGISPALKARMRRIGEELDSLEEG